MQEYEIQINGIPHTVLLDDETAAKAGLLKPYVREKARKPANKAVTPQNKEAAGDDTGSAAPARKRN